MTLARVDPFADEGPDFNADAARTIYGQIMKMDCDSAVMFGRMVVGAAVQRDLIVHRDEIEVEIGKVLTERYQVAKASLMRSTIAKARAGEDNTAEMAALVQLSKAGFIGSLFSSQARSERTRKQKRDLSTGRFEVMHEQIHHSDEATPIPGVYAGKLGIPDPDPHHTLDLTNEQRAQYQNGYYQIARLIRPFAELPKGDGRLTFHYADGTKTYAEMPHGRAGKEPAKIPLVESPSSEPVLDADGKEVPAIEGQHPNKEGLDPTRKVVAVSLDVVPGLNAQGGVFAALNALGLPGLGARTSGAMKGGALDSTRLAEFDTAWNLQGNNDEFAPSNKVFRRLGAGSDLIEDTLGATTPPQLRVALSVARHVGRLGPSAQKIVGPTLDRAAYRYRGTERKPEQSLKAAIDEADALAVRESAATTVADRALEEAQALKQVQLGSNRKVHRDRIEEINRAWAAAHRDYKQGRINRKAMRGAAKVAEKARAASDKRKYNADQAASDDLAAAEARYRKMNGLAENERSSKARQIILRGVDTDHGWERGPVLAWMKSRVPSSAASELQLKAGNVPPSEGIIIDTKGNVAAQTVGYGDDHYLPFTLRNLGKLKGGYYLRTRTFGGPTTEDFHAAIISGARGFTVVSNSGVFAVDFDADFKGGRRFNDKAARVIGRYGHLLDAIKGGGVAGADIDPTREREIYRDARDAYPDDEAGYDRAVAQAKARERTNPTLSRARKTEIATEYLNTAMANAGLSDGARQLPLDQMASVIAGEKLRQHIRTNRLSGMPTDAQEALRAQYVDALTDPDTVVMASNIAAAIPGQTQSGLQTAYSDELENMRRGMEPLKLNARGYEAALAALKDQFPYYIADTQFYRFRDGVDHKDTGYVKPLHNRPAEAQAGYFDRSISGGKKRADTIRGQNHHAVPLPATEITRDVDTEGQRAATGTAPSPPTAEDAARVRASADRALLEHILRQGTFSPEMPEMRPLADAGQPLPRIRDLLHERDFPVEARGMFGRPAEQVLAEQAADPVAFRVKLDDFLTWAEDANALKLNSTLLGSYHRGGMAAPSKTLTADAAIAEPNQDWDLGPSLGSAYDKAKRPTLLAVGNAYGDDALIRPLRRDGELPAAISSDDFKTAADALAENLRKANQIEIDWVSGGQGYPLPPLTREQIGDHAVGLARAWTLRRRYEEAVQRDLAARVPPPAPAPEAPVGDVHTTQFVMSPAEMAAMSPEDLLKLRDNMAALNDAAHAGNLSEEDDLTAQEENLRRQGIVP